MSLTELRGEEGGDIGEEGTEVRAELSERSSADIAKDIGGIAARRR